MKYGMIILCSAAILSLVACKSAITPEQHAVLVKEAAQPITCKAGKDCDQKWNRAIGWLSLHSHTKIKTLTDTNIVTNLVVASADNTQPVLKTPEFKVVKTLQKAPRKGKAQDKKKMGSKKKAGGVYSIMMTSYCEKGFACDPSALELKASFSTFVMGPIPGVSSHKTRPVVETVIPK